MLTSFLSDHAGKNPISFHMPGHKGSALYKKYGYQRFLDQFMHWDITEIPGADNLFQTEGVLNNIQERYAALYGAKQSYLLINGTSGGLIAAILAAVPAGRKLIMARNCHKSVFNALTLGNIDPVYAYPDMMEEHQVAGKISPLEIERLIGENSEAEAVILPSPNYYGICSDVQAISEVCHKAGKALIVDQAHGAHLKFFNRYETGADMPPAAEDCGADIVVNSTHKTLASLTQSAVLNLMTDRVNQAVLEDKLQTIQSTSPSYLLMASLDINADILDDHGPELFHQWRENLDYFYEKTANIGRLKMMTGKDLDRTKLNLDFHLRGISGARLEELLMDKGIFSELNTGNLLMCMTGIGNTRADYEALAKALETLSRTDHKISSARTEEAIPVPRGGKLYPVPRAKEMVPLKDTAGRICAGSIIPYPPGIPFVCPGEQITEEIIAYIAELRMRGEKVIGITAVGSIAVGKE